MDIDLKLDAICREILLKRDHKCIICGGNISVPVVAHWQKRRHTQTRWHLSNIHLACYSCNQQEESSLELSEQHSINVLEREGMEMYNELIILRNSNFKFSKSDKEEMLTHYKGLLKTMK